MNAIGPESSMNVETRFKKLDKLGEGTQGIVFKAIDNQNNHIVALKQIRAESREEGIPVTTLREIALLRDLNHANIAKLLEVISEEGKVQLVFEQQEWDLRKQIDRHPLTLPQIKSISQQMLLGTAYLHTVRVLHRDLKPQNLLITSDLEVKIADFGLSKVYGLPMDSFTHEVVTLWQRAPEVLMGNDSYDASIDTWSIGCIVAEMLQKRPLFIGDSEVDQIFKIFRGIGSPEEDQPGLDKCKQWSDRQPKWKASKEKLQKKVLEKSDMAAVDLIDRMVRVNPKERISARTALNHEWFADLDKSPFAEQIKFLNLI